MLAPACALFYAVQNKTGGSRLKSLLTKVLPSTRAGPLASCCGARVRLWHEAQVPVRTGYFRRWGRPAVQPASRRQPPLTRNGPVPPRRSYGAVGPLTHNGPKQVSSKLCRLEMCLQSRGESGARRTVKPVMSGNPSAASGDTKVKTAAGTSPLITRSIAFA